MDRRDSARRSRRLPVRFWMQGETEPSSGFTVNISESGVFISTRRILGRGSRVRIEICDPQNPFVVEGVVARGMRSAPSLQSIRPSGIGVRFLTVTELIHELFPASSSTEPTPSKGAKPAPNPEAAARQSEGLQRYSVRLRDAKELRRAYDRDVVQGGLFVRTQSPASIGEQVLLEIHLPGDRTPPAELKARVVHVISPSDDTEGNPNLLAGMGVAFLDPRAALEALEPPPD